MIAVESELLVEKWLKDVQKILVEQRKTSNGKQMLQNMILY